jgi:uncharacterized protein YbjQ (UPF0145 family)
VTDPNPPGSGLRGNAAVRTAGFTAIGPAIGFAAYQIPGLQQGLGCTYRMGMQAGSGGGFLTTNLGPAWTAPRGGDRLDGYRDAVTNGYRDAVAGLRADATRLRGHGVVGVRIEKEWADASTLKVSARGTVVRHAGSRRLDRPFVSAIGSAEFASLLAGGWVPCGVALGYAVHHAHWATVTAGYAYGRGRNRRWPGWDNFEFSEFTEIVSEARVDAERQLRASLTSIAADGCVGVDISLDLRPSPCGKDQSGRLVEVMALGTGIVRFGAGSAMPQDLQILLTPR